MAGGSVVLGFCGRIARGGGHGVSVRVRGSGVSSWCRAVTGVHTGHRRAGSDAVTGRGARGHRGPLDGG